MLRQLVLEITPWRKVMVFLRALDAVQKISHLTLAGVGACAVHICFHIQQAAAEQFLLIDHHPED